MIDRTEQEAADSRIFSSMVASVTVPNRYKNPHTDSEPVNVTEGITITESQTVIDADIGNSTKTRKETWIEHEPDFDADSYYQTDA